MFLKFPFNQISNFFFILIGYDLYKKSEQI